MIMLITDLEKKIIHFWENYSKYIMSGFLAGFLAYFMMMSLNLVNDLDGIWHLSNFIAGDWEISLGRGLQRYADKARFGIVSDAANSMITIFLISVANSMILAKFSFDSAVYKGLFLVVLVANPVICNALSYSYMSVNFGLAYFFSVVSFICIKSTVVTRKNIMAGILGGSAFLGISMAFYQAYVCLTTLLTVMYILKMILENKKSNRILLYAVLCFCTIISGGIIYLLITKGLLYRAGIQMASYRGASNINFLLMVKYLPYSIKQCYLEFAHYFFVEKAASNLEFIDIVLAGLSVIYLLSAVIRFVSLFRHNKKNAVLFVVMLISLPVASCFVLLIAVGNSMSGLMSMGMVMCVVMLGIIVPDEGKAGFVLKRIYLLFSLAFVWFQFSAVINDQLALKEGKTAAITLTENIVSQLYEGGYLDEYQTVAFVGRPANNDRFAQSTAYRMANEYAKFGCWSTDARNNRVSWNGVVSNFLGVNLNLCGDLEYQEIISSEEVADMPEFPSKGSVRVINDVVVVKVSEVY